MAPRTDSEIGDEFAIRHTLAAYCHICDDGGFDALAELFSPDGSFIFGDEVVTGRAAIVRWFEDRQSPERRGKHLTMNLAVDLAGDEAHVVSDFVFLRVADGVITPALTGRYTDDLVRLDGRWVIERRQAVLLGSTPG